MAGPGRVSVVFKAKAAKQIGKLSVVGAISELGLWHLEDGLQLTNSGMKGEGSQEEILWVSEPISVPSDSFPLEYRYVANGHRQSPTTRPLMWDARRRRCATLPEDGIIRDSFSPDTTDCDSGWVTEVGMGAFQLRVGQPPGSQEPLVTVEDDAIHEPFRVRLYEARGGDPAVPEGKPFARLTCKDLGLPEPASSGSFLLLHNDPEARVLNDNNVTFLMNAPTLEALAFRVDVTNKETGQLLARCFVPHQCLAGLEGSVSVALMTPDLRLAGWFRAAFLVVTACNHPDNTLCHLQRQKWSAAIMPKGSTFDIGHRGAGSSKGTRSVRENTLLSFQKAATNHTEFIEFDVHVTGDGEVIVHHDFDVKLNIGEEIVKVGIPALKYRQLISSEFTQHMHSLEHREHNVAMDAQRSKQKRSLKRAMSSAEDWFLSARPNDTPPAGGSPSEWHISDRIATLREAFANTPDWLGFNVELKYPTDAELAQMGTRFYSRNYFCDQVLKVVFEAAGDRKVIFSTFDPDCATLMSLKQPRYPVLFLTCAGSHIYSDPRMNSLEAAMAFALSSHLQGVVAESAAILGRLDEVVAEFHRLGLFLFTWGDDNNNMEHYLAQKAAGVDAIIFDDVARMAKVNGKKASLFNRPMKAPATFDDVPEEDLLHEAPRGLQGSMSSMRLSHEGSLSSALRGSHEGSLRGGLEGSLGGSLRNLGLTSIPSGDLPITVSAGIPITAS